MMQHFKVRTTLLIVAISLPFLANKTTLAEDQPFTTDVFVSGKGGYHTYRIPAVIVTPEGHATGILRRPEDEPFRSRRPGSGPPPFHRRRQDMDTHANRLRGRRRCEGHDRQSVSGRRTEYGPHLVTVLPQQRRRAGHVQRRRREDLGQAP